MKVDLKKKRALAAAVLLTLGCYGQAWAEDKIINDSDLSIRVENTKKDIGSMDDNITVNNKDGYLYFANKSVLNLSANKLILNGNQGHSLIGGGGTVNINAKDFSSEGFIIEANDADNPVIVNINQNSEYKNSAVKIKGDIYVKNTEDEINKNLVTANIDFNGEKSYFKGSSRTINGTINLNFSEGAKWINDGNSRISNLKLEKGAMIEFNDENRPFGFCIEVEKEFNGDGGLIKINFDGSEGVEKTFETYYPANTNFIFAQKHTGVTNVILNNIGADDLGAAGTVIAKVVDEKGFFNNIKAEGALSWDKYTLDRKEGIYKPTHGEETNCVDWYIKEITHETAPTTSVNTLLSTVTAGYDTWRNDTDKFNERMGELRMNGAGNDGVWVRTKGSEFGRHGGNGSYTNKQQTYQLGYDAVTSKDDKQTTYTGVAAEYGKGSLSFDSGTGTMKSMGLGVYQTKMYESGHYLDLVGRFDKYKNDFHVADTQGNAISGKYGNNVLSLSAEYGRKNELKHGWYVEPQSEVTLGYMFGNDFTTSNNIRVEQKNMPALIGRLGLNIGREVNDKVNFYVKASMNHDFLGNYDMQMTDMKSGERLGASDRFGSSWFDYGAGLSVKTGKDSYAYFDIERAVGGEYKKNWDWNAGVRWSF